VTEKPKPGKMKIVKSTPPEPRTLELASSRYKPTKADMEEPLEFPDGTTPEEVARAVMQRVKIVRKPRP